VQVRRWTVFVVVASLLSDQASLARQPMRLVINNSEGTPMPLPSRFDADTLQMTFSTYFGGSGEDAGWGMLRRLGADRCRNSLAISRGKLMARWRIWPVSGIRSASRCPRAMREAQEHPDWRWERERRIETLRPAPRKSKSQSRPNYKFNWMPFRGPDFLPPYGLLQGSSPLHAGTWSI
jgi:hypothetical protein